MPRFARFAASFPEAVALAVLLLLSPGSLAGADLRPLKEPSRIPSVFPKAAKVRLLNVWATWCVPCVAEMPDLLAIDAAFGSEVALAGVTLDDMIPDAEPARVSAFLDRQKIAFPNVYYTGSPDALGEHLQFSGEIPVTIVYDRTGREVWRHQGRLDRNATIARLREILRRMQ